ncbi:MAG: hypothetical protein HYU67_09755 [Flavobacteriia bacterium]|nr:hypothetical protein [Flavobacteriia bacterium]
MKKNLLNVLLIFGVVGFTNAQKLDKFGAEMGKKTAMGKEIRVPYTDLSSYFGYIKPGSAPDEVRDGKNFYYLYIWIPAVAPELGIRMISPIPEGTKPTGTDFVSPNYIGNEGENKNFFDTWITFEKASGIVKKEDIMNAKSAKWNSLGTNDDSGEMPAQPSGSKYNSLMRILSETSDPLKSLTVGLYRVGFTTYKKGEVQGGFLAQVGAPVKLPGVAISSDLDGIMKALNK